MVAESIVSSVRNYFAVLNANGLSIRFGVVYGSQTNGRADEWSDIDLIVVSPEFDGERERKNELLLWHIAGKTDSRIEPIPCGVKQWEEDDVSTIIEVARREGVRVDPENP